MCEPKTAKFPTYGTALATFEPDRTSYLELNYTKQNNFADAYMLVNFHAVIYVGSNRTLRGLTKRNIEIDRKRCSDRITDRQTGRQPDRQRRKQSRQTNGLTDGRTI